MEPKTDRWVALIDNVAKYYAGLNLEELKDWATGNAVIPLNQTRFSKDMETTINILIIYLLIDVIKTANLLLYLCFIDYASACDHIDREKLWDKLAKKDILSGLLK
ncbi:hypothetical protein NDU88_001020 [Pleurodeles waltl]|uniref:Reverse transcriptase domain-containing protein n=1 Tax=Pleurodeles waltl TaxID=8319 RepID=A0AAV7M6Z1_PLEWA|nr:hypothetical protein NDU88_001020 [Pleurodeles waltl]